MKLYKLLCIAACLVSTSALVAQEQKTDEKKIQEVITMNADPVSLPPLPDGTIPTDTSTASKPMAQTEILKRAVNYIKIETKKYKKSNGVNVASKAECVATFNYKPKELNPQADVEGTITMHISIEAKDGKYRYTISKIHHNAKNADYSGGDIYGDVPKCGSMKIPSDLWIRIRSEAGKATNVVVSDLKEFMKLPSDAPLGNGDEW